LTAANKGKLELKKSRKRPRLQNGKKVNKKGGDSLRTRLTKQKLLATMVTSTRLGCYHDLNFIISKAWVTKSTRRINKTCLMRGVILTYFWRKDRHQVGKKSHGGFQKKGSGKKENHHKTHPPTTNKQPPTEKVKRKEFRGGGVSGGWGGKRGGVKNNV